MTKNVLMCLFFIANISLGNASYAAPENPTQISPSSGSMAGFSSEFVWQDQDDATEYRLYVYNNEIRSRVHLLNYAKDQVCAGGICSVTPDISLGFAKNHRWFLRARNGDGYSAWSKTYFNILETKPDAVVTVLPIGVLDAAPSTFQWNNLPNASKYQVLIRDTAARTNLLNKQYTVAAVCEADNCQLEPVGLSFTPTNRHVFRVRGSNTGGWGPWSSSSVFSTLPSNNPPLALDDTAIVVSGHAVTIDVLTNDTDSDGNTNPSEVTITIDAEHGDAVVQPNGTVLYTHDGGAAVNDTFSYMVLDDDGEPSNTAQVSITIEPLPNDAPAALDDVFAVTAGEAGLIDVVANDNDDSPVTDLVISIVSLPAYGGAEVVNGQIEYDHDGADGIEFPTDSFTYLLTDVGGLESNIATVNITVEAVNDAPLTASDSVDIAKGESIAIVVLANDSDPNDQDGNSPLQAIDPTSVQIIFPDASDSTQAPLNGTLEVDEINGTVTYTHDDGAATNASFRYTVADLQGARSLPAQVSITIAQPQNLQPLANDDSITLDQGSTALIDVLGNDQDDNPLSALTIAVSDLPVYGTAIAANGQVEYVHNGDSGVDFPIDTFTYTLTDEGGLVSAKATVTVNVTPVVEPPLPAPQVVNDDVEFLNGDLVIVDVLANDTGSIDPTSVAVSVDDAPSTGTIAINSTSGVITYTPYIGVPGGTVDQFGYTVQNTEGLISDVAIVTVTIGDFNASDDQVTVAQGGSVDIEVLANDVGSLNPGTVVTNVDPQPQYGTLETDPGTGVITYQPGVDVAGGTVDQFGYTVQSNRGVVSNIATVTVTIEPSAVVLMANEDTATVAADGSVDVVVLANDTGDIDVTTVTTNVLPAPTKGYLSTDENTGVITYAPYAGNASATDTFGYLVKDSAGVESNVAIVTVTIESLVDTTFMANADAATVAEDGIVEIAVLANDTGDIDVTTVTTNVLPAPTKGYLSTDENTGVITYAPYAGNASATDTFGYLVKDSVGVESNIAIVTVTIDPAGVIFMANADTATVSEDGSVEIVVLANDTGDIDETTVNTNVLPAPTKGYLSANETTGVVTYTPYAGNAGVTDTFGYSVKDNAGVESNVAIVTVTIGDDFEPQQVLAVNDSASLIIQTSLLINVLANDEGANTTPVIDSLQITVDPGHGSVAIQQGQVLYTHTSHDLTADAFTYAITDDQGSVSSATVAITIDPLPNEAPIAVDDQRTLTAYDEVQIMVMANDYDNDIDDSLDASSVTIVEQPLSGLISVDAGVVTYMHDGSLGVSDYFSYSVADSRGEVSNIAIVDLTIEPYPDTAPVVVDDSFSLVADTIRTFDVLANDTDKNHNIDASSLVIVQAPVNGTVEIVDGSVVYDHDGGASETDSFTYKVSDLTNLESETLATVSITLEPIMPPQVADDSITLTQGESVVIDVLANDTANTSINPASILITLDPEHDAEFDVQDDGLIVYTHKGNGSLTDTIKYKVANDQGMQSLTEGVVSIKILPPLVTINELRYEGAFKFPGNTYGDSTVNYAQGVIEVNGGSMFIVGHNHDDAIAEFLVPTLVKDSFELSNLNAAESPVQDFAQVINRAATGNPELLDQITGLELVDGRLFVNLMEFYDGPGDNSLTTMVISDADQLATSQVSALHSMDGAARAAGWLSPVPEIWKDELEADFISGHASGDPIISRLSVGPSAFMIDLPGSLQGTTSRNISTTELQGFSLDNPLRSDLYNTTGSNSVWTHLSRARYGFIVPGTGTYMTLGWSGGHNSGVGYKLTRPDGSECPGFCANDESDMHNYFWLWKVEDWLRVKAGEIQPHEIEPYESGELDLPFQTNGALNEIGGASYDPLTGLLYVSILRANEQGYDLTPVVVAYQVNTPVYVD